MPTATQSSVSSSGSASAFRAQGDGGGRATSAAYALRGSGGLSATRSQPVTPPVVAPPRAVPVPAPRARSQTRLLLVMTLAAFVTVVTGLIYLSGHARITQEGYRRARLKAQLRQAQELSQQWRQRQAVVNTPASIEARALALGMIRADDKQTVTLP